MSGIGGRMRRIRKGFCFPVCCSVDLFALVLHQGAVWRGCESLSRGPEVEGSVRVSLSLPCLQARSVSQIPCPVHSLHVTGSWGNSRCQDSKREGITGFMPWTYPVIPSLYLGRRAAATISITPATEKTNNKRAQRVSRVTKSGRSQRFSFLDLLEAEAQR